MAVRVPLQASRWGPEVAASGMKGVISLHSWSLLGLCPCTGQGALSPTDWEAELRVEPAGPW